MMLSFKSFISEACWKGYKQYGMKEKGGKQVPNCVPEQHSEMKPQDGYDSASTTTHKRRTEIGKHVHSHKPIKPITTEEKSPAWQRKAGKNPEGGLNKKGVASYRRENPGSKLKTAVTTKPSKLDPDSKAAKRRKSFCARMGGMKKRLTSAKTSRDPDSRINKALRKWNC